MSEDTITTIPSSNFNWPGIGGTPVPVVVQISRVQKGQLRVQAYSFSDGFPSPYGTISTVPSDGRTRKPVLATEPDEFYVKDYNENEGLLAALIEQGLVIDTGKTVKPVGSYVKFPLAKLTEKGRALAPELFH